MFTNIEGDIDDVLKVIRDATMKLAGQGYRTDVVIRLDIPPRFRRPNPRQAGACGRNPVGINPGWTNRVSSNKKARYLQKECAFLIDLGIV